MKATEIAIQKFIGGKEKHGSKIEDKENAKKCI